MSVFVYAVPPVLTAALAKKRISSPALSSLAQDGYVEFTMISEVLGAATVSVARGTMRPEVWNYDDELVEALAVLKVRAEIWIRQRIIAEAIESALNGASARR